MRPEGIGVEQRILLALLLPLKPIEGVACFFEFPTDYGMCRAYQVSPKCEPVIEKRGLFVFRKSPVDQVDGSLGEQIKLNDIPNALKEALRGRLTGGLELKDPVGDLVDRLGRYEIRRSKVGMTRPTPPLGHL